MVANGIPLRSNRPRAAAARMNLNVGDILIVKNRMTWARYPSGANCAEKGDIFIVISIDPIPNAWDYAEEENRFTVDLLGVNHLIHWTPQWDGISYLFCHAS